MKKSALALFVSSIVLFALAGHRGLTKAQSPANPNNGVNQAPPSQPKESGKAPEPGTSEKPAPAVEKPQPLEAQSISMNFSGTSLKEVLRVFEQYTGKRFLFDEQVVARRTVNLFSSTPIPASALIPVLESILEVHGLTLVKAGTEEAEIYKIVEVKQAAGKATPTFTAKSMNAIPESDRVVTLVYQLRFIPAEQVAAAFKDMTTVPEGIQAINGTNILRVTDYAANVKRIGKILSELDEVGPQIVRKTIKLKHVDPAELVREIQPILDIENRIYVAQLQKQMEARMRQILSRLGRSARGSAGRGSILLEASPIAVAAIPRLRSIVLSATEDKIADIEKLILTLDIEDPDQQVIEYYRLKHQSPTALAETIQAIFGIGKSRGQLREDWRIRKEAAPSRAQAALTVVPDALGGRLVVVAPKALHEKIAQVIERLDSIPLEGRELRSFPVKYADVQSLSEVISRLFGLSSGETTRVWKPRRPGRPGGVQGPRGGADVIIPETNLNCLIAVARKELLEKIQHVISQLDTPSPSRKVVRYYRLSNISPAAAAETITALFQADRQSRRKGVGQAAPDRSITAVPNDAAGTLVVLATPEVHTEIAEIIKNLDVEGALLTLGFYPIKHTELNDLAQALGRLFNLPVGTDTSQLARLRNKLAARFPSRPTQIVRRAGLSEQPVIIPDPNLQALLVLADKKTHDLLADALSKLDVQGPGKLIVKSYKLSHNTASTVASILNELYGARRITTASRRGRPVTETGAVITADDATATVVVSAREVLQEEIAALIAELDVESPIKKVVRYYKLAYADPADIVQTLTSLYPQGGPRGPAAPRYRRRSGPAGATHPEDRSIAVASNEKMQTVVVLATPEVHTEIADIIKNLDVEGATMQLRYYTVTNADLDTLAETISRLFQIEIRRGASPLSFRSARSGAPRRLSFAGFSREPVIIPDANLSALVVLADARTQELIGEAVKKLDSAGPGAFVTRYYRILHTSVSEIATTLQSIYSGTQMRWPTRAGRSVRFVGRPAGVRRKTAVIVPNEELSMVVVSAPEEVHQEIAQIIENMDVESVRDQVLKYYKIQHADLEEAADLVAKIFDLSPGGTSTPRTRRPMPGRPGASTGPRTPFAKENIVIADHNLGALLIVAPKEVHQEIAKVIERIDSEGPGRREIKQYRVARANVREVATTLSYIFNLQLATAVPRRTRAGAPPPTSVVIPNETLGSVIVVAPADTQAKVKDVIEGLSAIGPDENELQYYTIQKADLTEAANIVSQIFGIPLGTVEQAFRGRTAREGAELLMKERVIIPNEALKTLLVVAPHEMQAEIAETIKRIDAVGPRDNVFRMYEVTVSEVTTAAKTISQLFDIKLLQPGASPLRPIRGLATGPKITTEPFILPDEDLGALIVNAPEEIHSEIKKVLEKLISIGKQEKMSIRFYQLKNTDPVDVAYKIGQLFNITVGDIEALREARGTTTAARRTTRGTAISRRARATLEEEDEEKKKKQQQAAQGQQKEEAAPRPAGPVTKREFYFEGESVVIPDKNLNSIILIAPNYIHQEVSEVLKTIDVRRPQVLFEVAILEVSGDDSLEIGAEIGTINRQGADRARGHGFTNFGLSTRQSSPQGGFPEMTTVPTDLPGLFVGITKGEVGNIPLLLRLLRQTTDVKIRSTPLLLVNDNQEAEFRSLLEQPTTTVSQGTATTNISFAGFVEAGTVLHITPHVSEGNYIRVDIQLNVDNFHGEPIAPGIPPPRSSNVLNTSITVPNKRTVVIGGLSTTKKTSIIKKVPILGSIPLLGYLFSSSVQQEVTSRLFLFIKPTILDDVDFEDLNRISIKKSFEAHGITGEHMVGPEESGPDPKKGEGKAQNETQGEKSSPPVPSPAEPPPDAGARKAPNPRPQKNTPEGAVLKAKETAR